MRPTDPRLREALRPARLPLTGVLASGVLGSLLLVGQAWVVAGLVVAVVQGGDTTTWGLLVMAVLAARAVVEAAGATLAARAAGVVATDLRSRLARVLVERPDARVAGEVAVLATRGVAAAEPYLTRYLPALVLAAVLPPLTLLALASQDLLSAGIVLATLPLVPVFGALVGFATRDRAARQWRVMASLSMHFLDVVRGLPTLVAYRRARAQSARIREITDRYRRASLDTLRIAFASSAVLELVATLSVALVAVTVGVRLAGGDLDLRTSLVVLLLAPEAYWPLRRVGAEFHAAAEGTATFGRAAALLEPAPVLTTAGTGPDAGAGAGPVVLDRVSVRYPGRRAPALRDVTAVVPDRGVTVVTGPSGCGKSTLLGVLTGQVPVCSGAVAAGGTSVSDPAWQRQVAWLPQRPSFVAGTVADNLRLGSPGAEDQRLWQALRQVALEERVRALPRGLDAPLGEDGLTLSAGERARLALARVVVADRPWVLLDEPTAHLDQLTEQVIADTVSDLGRDRAVVVVAHRPALVAVADHRLDLPPAVPAVASPPAPRSARGTPQEPPLEPGTADSSPAPRAGLGVATLLGSLSSAAGVALTATAGWLIVQASTHPPVLTLLVAVVGVRAFGLARPVLRYAERLLSHDVALRLLADRRVRVYESLVPLTPGRLGRRRGDLLASVVDDVDAVVDRELRVRLPVRTLAGVAVVASVVATALAPAAGAVVAATALLPALVGHGLARRGAARAEESAVRDRAVLSQHVVEAVQMASELHSWQAGDRVAASVARIASALAAARQRSARWLAAGRSLVVITGGVAVAATAWVAAPAVAAGNLSAPLAALLVLLPLALVDVALPAVDAGTVAARCSAAERRLNQLARTPPAVRDTVCRPLPAGRDVRVDGARVRWPGAAGSTPAVSLHLRPGERVALLGRSGSGKSTVAALMLRFVDPVAGSVSMAGVPLSSLSLDDVRRVTGLVDDDPHVFGSTLAENVRLARPGATDAQVEAALRRARLGPWLDSLPDGLDTWVGDGHAAVSGGERARLGLARSLLARHDVLVLDEPTAHLDHATATEVATEVLSAPGGRSVLWISHGDAGLDLVDRVVDLDAVAAPWDTGGSVAATTGP